MRWMRRINSRVEKDDMLVIAIWKIFRGEEQKKKNITSYYLPALCVFSIMESSSTSLECVSTVSVSQLLSVSLSTLSFSLCPF